VGADRQQCLIDRGARRLFALEAVKGGASIAA
jgi:hypothetical protein